jgi:hypothetical protein
MKLQNVTLSVANLESNLETWGFLSVHIWQLTQPVHKEIKTITCFMWKINITENCRIIKLEQNLQSAWHQENFKPESNHNTLPFYTYHCTNPYF